MSDRSASIGVIGATGAVGEVTLGLLAERGYSHVRAFGRAVCRSRVAFGSGELRSRRRRPTCSPGRPRPRLFTSASASHELSRNAVRGGGSYDKSAAYRSSTASRLLPGNGRRALEHDGIVANPNCCAIPLSMALNPLHNAVGLARVRVATYQSVSGAGARAVERLLAQPPAEHDLAMDWDFDGVEFDEEAKLRDETRKILELPDLPISASCMRVPVPVGHAEAVWWNDRRSRRRARRRSSRRRRACVSKTSPPRGRRRVTTTCSSGGCAAIQAPRTACACSSSATTSARELR
jgi:aspartate-semialdehyde dehydrogenase